MKALSAGTLGLAMLAALAIPSAQADEWGSGGYVGGNFGRTRAHIGDERIVNTLLGPGFVATSIGRDERDTGFKLFFHNDTKKGELLLTPREVLALRPRPLYIQYQ